MPSVTSSQRITRAIGQVVKELRNERGLTQEELAFEADLNKNHISKIERAKTSVSVVVLFAVAKALDLQLANLIGRVEKTLK